MVQKEEEKERNKGRKGNTRKGKREKGKRYKEKREEQEIGYDRFILILRYGIERRTENEKGTLQREKGRE